MATTKINSSELKYLTQQRTRIETKMAMALYDVYNRQPIIGSLREIVGMAIENLVGFAMGKEPAVMAALKAEKFLGAWRGQPPTGEGLYEVWKNRNTWTASECADLLRLFGTVLDEVKNVEDKSIKEAWTEGTTAHRAARVGPTERFVNNPEGQDRARTKTKSLAKSSSHSVAGRDLIKQIKMGGPTAFFGIDAFRLMEGSIIRKIDVAFALPEGADISGTTADSVFGMNRVSSFAKACEIALPGSSVPADILHLLPLVSMISQGHHTIVESATVLTLNGIIQYSIGSYSTLLPTKCGTYELMGELRKIVASAEAHTFNQPILAYYDPSTQQYSGYKFDRNDSAEMVKFRKLATVGDAFLKKFQNISALVPKDQIDAMMGDYGLAA